MQRKFFFWIQPDRAKWKLPSDDDRCQMHDHNVRAHLHKKKQKPNLKLFLLLSEHCKTWLVFHFSFFLFSVACEDFKNTFLTSLLHNSKTIRSHGLVSHSNSYFIVTNVVGGERISVFFFFLKVVPRRVFAIETIFFTAHVKNSNEWVRVRFPHGDLDG